MRSLRMFLSTVAAGLALVATPAYANECANWQSEHPEWIWCDDFEDSTPLSSKYYDFDGDNGDMTRISSQKKSGNWSLRGRWQAGEDDAGHFMRTFGRNPVNSQSHSSEDFREIYWRHYFKLQDGFVGRPDKFTRIFVFTSTNWAQAMISHIWLDENAREKLMQDPASGVSGGTVVTTGWNDFAHLQWLGGTVGETTLEDGRWYCLEGHVKLNDPGYSNGIAEFWLDGNLEARRTNLNFVGTYTGYALNTLSFEHYWNAGSPVQQDRYFDALVISRSRIGCLDTSPPSPPTGVTATIVP